MWRIFASNLRWWLLTVSVPSRTSGSWFSMKISSGYSIWRSSEKWTGSHFWENWGNLEQASPKRKLQRITRIWEVSLRRQEKPPMTATWKVPARLVLYSRLSPRRLPSCISPSKTTINPLRMPVTSRNCCLPWWEKAMKMQWKNSFRQVAITLRDISLPTSRNYRDSITLRDGISTSMIPGRKLNVNIVHLAMRDMVMPDGKKHGTFIPVVKNVKPMRRFHVINPFLRMRTRK